jgi:hypothetical protein
MRKQSLKNPLCMCCKTVRGERENSLFCKNCNNFLYKRLGLKKEYVSKILSNADFRGHLRIKTKCSLCNRQAVIIHGDYAHNKKYYLCQQHYDRWMKIGYELSDFIENFFD